MTKITDESNVPDQFYYPHWPYNSYNGGHMLGKHRKRVVVKFVRRMSRFDRKMLDRITASRAKKLPHDPDQLKLF